MKDVLEVLAPGTDVTIGPEDSAGLGQILTAAVRSGPTVQYEVVWWSGRERRTEWFQQWEVHPLVEGKTLKIGFK